MASLSDLLFGSSGETNVQSASTLTPEQEKALRDLLAGFDAEGGGAGFEAEAFGGQLSAGLGEGEQLSLAALEQKSLNSGNDPLNREGNEALLEIIRNRGSTGGFDDFFKTNVSQPLTEDFSENVLPNIIRDFGGAQFASSERGRADTNARDDLITQLTRSRSDLALRDRDTSANRLLEAIGLQGNRQSAGIDDLLKVLQAQGLPREVEQEGLDRDFGEFVRQDEARNTRIQQILQSLGIQGTENIATAFGGQTGLLQILASALAGGAGEGLGQRVANPAIGGDPSL